MRLGEQLRGFPAIEEPSHVFVALLSVGPRLQSVFVGLDSAHRSHHGAENEISCLSGGLSDKTAALEPLQ